MSNYNIAPSHPCERWGDMTTFPALFFALVSAGVENVQFNAAEKQQTHT